MRQHRWSRRDRLPRFVDEALDRAWAEHISGSAGGSFIVEIAVLLLGRNLCVQIRSRSRAFRQLSAELAGRDLLIVPPDGCELLVALRLPISANAAAAPELGGGRVA
jgi:hypothetical protein